MAKEKTEKKPKKEKFEGTTIDSAKLANLLARLKKLIGEPESVVIRVTKEGLFTGATYPGGFAHLADKDALLSFEKKVDVTLPFAVLLAAVKGRGPITLKANDSHLVLKDSNFSAELAISAPLQIDSVAVEKGIDSAPIASLISQAGSLLQLKATIEGTPLDILTEWTKESITAAVADNYHAVVVKGKGEFKKSGSLALPLDLANKLNEIGGKFDLGETSISANSDKGSASLRFVGQGASVPLASIVALATKKSDWSVEIDAEQLHATLASVHSVVEFGQKIDINVEEGVMSVRGESRFGKIKSKVEYVKSQGKAPKKISINPFTLDAIASKVSGPSRLSLSGNILRIEPLKQKAWEFIGFVSLSS